MPIEFEDVDRVVATVANIVDDPMKWVNKTGITNDALNRTTDRIISNLIEDAENGADSLLNIQSTILMALIIGWEIRDQIGRKGSDE